MKFIAASSMLMRPGKKRTAKKSRGASMRVEEKPSRAKFVFPKKTFFILLGVIVLSLAGVNFKSLYDKVNTQKIEHVVIDGGLDYVKEEEVEAAVQGFLNQSLVSVNLDAVKESLELNPWIKFVSIQREWPDTLIINVQEEQAIAKWGKAQLLNQEGEIFSPQTLLNQTHLPFLSGPDGDEFKVMEQYQQFSKLLYAQGMSISSLSLNARGAWKMELADGISVSLGKDKLMEKISRFVGSIDYLRAEETADIDTVDLRYSNGIAVTRREYLSEEVVSR